MVERALRPVDLAREAGISVQQVRNYEATGVLPPAARSAHGYRRYTAQHRAALSLARQASPAYGWPVTRRLLRAVHAGQLDEALALIDAHHAALDAARRQLDQTEAALTALAAAPPVAHQARPPRRLRIGAAAALVDVAPSALRSWEELGLIRPHRDPRSNYRIYDERLLRRLHVVALLRRANHDSGPIQATLTALDAGDPERALAVLNQRRGELAAASWRSVATLRALHEYVSDWPPGQRPPAASGLAPASPDTPSR